VIKNSFLLLVTICLSSIAFPQRTIIDFNKDWKFHLGDNITYSQKDFNHVGWKSLDLPHDWSIEGKFDSINPAGNAGGALPGGIGWYRKTFSIPVSSKGKKSFIEFDGIYRNSEVWVNGYFLGKWPYGYTTFRYDLTPYLQYGTEENILAVRVDNAQQPNSRWYSGSGIYRDVRLITTGTTFIDNWGLFITTPKITKNEATVDLKINLQADDKSEISVLSKIFNANGKLVSQIFSSNLDVNGLIHQIVRVKNPVLWSVKNPYLYRLETQIFQKNKLSDTYSSTFGVRYFDFDKDKGFSLNGESLKILGVCMHHDLGALGAAFNKSAARRQLQVLKNMGCNAIRTAHNPPAPQVLDLCDEMGFW